MGCVRLTDTDSYRRYSEQMRPLEQKILLKQRVNSLSDFACNLICQPNILWVGSLSGRVFSSCHYGLSESRTLA